MLCLLLIPDGTFARERKSSDDFKPGLVGAVCAGYVYSQSGGMLNCADVQLGWQFNPYLVVGGSVGNTFTEPFEACGFVSVTADARGILPVGRRVSLFGEAALGVGIGYGEDSLVLFHCGPGVRWRSVSFGIFYRQFSDFDNGLLFRVGWHF